MITILIVMVIGLIIYLIRSQNKNNSGVSKSNTHKPTVLSIDTPVNFGYKCMWIAVKTNNKERIAQVLGLKNRQPSNWQTGIAGAYNDRVFISPQVSEWTLAVGFGLSNVDGGGHLVEEENYKEIINKLSKEFGEAQFFASHRVVEYHVWAKSINGKTIRYYSYVGEKGENILVEGEPTDVEKQYNFINTFSKEAKDKNYFARTDLTIPDEDVVMKIAAAWSVDPTKLAGRKDVSPGLGIVGKR